MMVSGYILSSLIISVCLMMLGLIIFLRDPKASLNKYFFINSISTSLWLISNYLGGDPHLTHTQALLANKALFIFGGLSILLLLFFVEKLTNQKLPKAIYIYLNILILFSCITPLVVNNVELQRNTYVINFGPLSYVFFLSLIINIILIIFILAKAHTKTTGLRKRQIDYILISLFIMLSGITITNVVMPSVFGVYGLTNMGSYFIPIVIAGIGYVIIKHRLFDIRLAIVRSLSYLLSFFLLILLFVSSSFIFTSLIFNNLSKGYTELIYITESILLVILFPYIKKAFNKITNGVFYRDAYDPQEFYDSLNKILISTPEISRLSRQVASLIEKVMKTQFCIIGLGSKDGPDYRVFGTEHLNFKDEDVARTRSLTPYIHKSVIVTDALDDDQSELKNLLNQNDVSVLVRLTNNVNKSVDGIGYLLLGPKKSGNQYSSLDIQVLDTFSKELVIAIQNSLHYEEIEQFNVTLQDRVNQATSKLRKTNEKLRTLDEAKDDFISMASHQLRTPLTSVKGYISLILDGDAGKISSLQRKMLAQAFSSSQKMVYLIADLLNLSRLKTGKFAIEPSEVNLADLVEEEVAQLIETAKNKQISLIYQKPDNFPKLYLDNTKIRQVVMNYIDNAIYYTQTGGKINIVLEEKAQTIEFKVIDNGIGVPRTEAHHLFTKFYRASNARKNRPDGTGLGLFMVKKIIIAEGGSILFDSKEGEGSTFGFVFAKQKLKITKDDNLKVKSI